MYIHTYIPRKETCKTRQHDHTQDPPCLFVTRSHTTQVGFSRLAPRMTMARTLKLFKLPEEPLLPGLRPLEKRDVASACKLLSNYLKHFQLAPVMTEEEFEYWFLTREGVIYTYVLEVGLHVIRCW